MELAIQLLILLIPSAIILLVTYLMNKGNTDMIRDFFREEIRIRKEESRMMNQNITAPLRIQAYERMILFLERISPPSLIMRTHHAGMTSHMLHAELLKAIRSEYEHNMAQQVYLSVGAWEMIRTAKEETTKLINITAQKMNESASGLDLGESLLNLSSQLKKLPTDVAIEYLKKEFNEKF